MKKRILSSICLSVSLFIISSSVFAQQSRMKIMSKAPNGHGMLCESQGKKILFLSGTPEQMGQAHGQLLAKDIGKMLGKIFLVGGAYSVKKNDWYFSRMEEVFKRTKPYMPKRFYRECDAMSKAAGITKEEGRHINFFPEMFHCSGLAVRNKASIGGTVLHARVLDYMRDIGLQEAATIIVSMPDGKNSWINVSYAGFIGTVTAMNEKGLAIGEIGGRGEGKWDGMPMNFLLREIMENASTVDEALEIFRKTPRTCEYYYVISDKKRNIVGVYSLSGKPIELIKPGEQNPKLPHIPEDTVIVSGRKRADVISQRIQDSYGKIEAKRMIEIIKRPAAMNSNLHNAVFAPETLDIWISDAGKKSPACDNYYAHFNLNNLLKFYEKAEEVKVTDND